MAFHSIDYVKVWVVAEHRSWRDDCEAGVWLISETFAQAEAFALSRVEAPVDDDEPLTSWYMELREMTVGVPLNAEEPRIVINRRGERAEHPLSLDTRP